MDIAALNILYVDDQEDLLGTIKEASAGHQLSFLKNSLTAYEHFIENDFDLVVSDIFMPFVDGFQLYKQIRKINSEVPFIFLSVNDSHQVVSRSLNLERTQFANRGLSPGHLKALIENCTLIKLNREIDTIAVDLRLSQVRIADQVFTLTPIEARILDFILSKGKSVTKDQLKDAVWSDIFVSNRTLQTHVGNIREKLTHTGITIRTTRDGYVEILQKDF